MLIGPYEKILGLGTYENLVMDLPRMFAGRGFQVLFGVGNSDDLYMLVGKCEEEGC